MNSFYKIKNSEGLYSTGGSTPRFTKTGKSWNNIGHVKSHLACLYRKNYYSECSLVEIIPVEIKETDIKELFKIVEDNKELKLQKRTEQIEAYKRERELAELKRLQEKYK